MKVSTLATLFTFISIAVAHNPHNARHARIAKRQDPNQPPSAAPSASAPVVPSQPAPAPSAPGAPGASAPPHASGSASINIPNVATMTGLAAITSGMPAKPTLPVTASYHQGQKPPFDGAPALPKPFVFHPGAWPPQDRVPDTNSPEVQEWLRELEGFDIPNLEPTVDGTCASSPQFAADAEKRGWWSCGGWVRPTDVVACPDKYTWGVSFDDGPSPYTTTLLKYLDEKQLKSTFFVVGSRVIERPQVLIDEYMTGHEISVHTWSHRPLTSLTTEEIVAELGWTRKAIRTVLGVTPTTMRPPYGDIDDRVRAITMAMGMEPIMWTRAPSSGSFDTFDWRVPAGVVTGVEAVTQFEKILTEASQLNTGFIVLQHDLYEITVELAAHYFIEEALKFTPKLTLEPIGQCLNRPVTDMYLETTTNKTFPFPNSVAGQHSGLGAVNGAISTSTPASTIGAAILALFVAAFV